tara:strand:+ start:640 stop:1323 length:684 start_codon:yes stop_codon:yes gene_type:complete
MSEEEKSEAKLEEPTSISEAEAVAAKAHAETKSKKASPEQIAKAEEAFKKARVKVNQMRLASEANWKAEYDQAKKLAEKIAAEGGDPNQAFTNKRKRERVFRREMGEPEFWQTKEDRAPARPPMTQDEEREITMKVQIPTNQIPKYEPQHILTPGFGGASNYEAGIDDLLEETKQKIDRLKNDPDASEDEINLLMKDVKTLDSLSNNYNIGMNVFRIAKSKKEETEE